MNICVQSGGLTGHFNTTEVFQHIADAGFSSVDLNIDTALPRDILFNHRNEGKTVYEKSMPEIIAYFQPQLDAIKAAGLYVYQAHAPFPAALMSQDLSILDYTIEVYKKCILLCQHMGCRRLIIHGISMERGDLDHTEKDVSFYNEKLYTSLIDTLKQTDVVVCLENLFTNYSGTIMEGTCSDPHDAIDQIDRYNAIAGKECFGLCVDTGHLNLLGKNQYAYITTLGKRVKAFHIHDNDGKSDLHLAPYTGTVNWEAFCRAVRDIGYEGDLSFETFAQYKPDRVQDTRAVLPLLNLVAEMGRLFRLKISE